jgi:hypothetical protein
VRKTRRQAAHYAQPRPHGRQLDDQRTQHRTQLKTQLRRSSKCTTRQALEQPSPSSLFPSSHISIRDLRAKADDVRVSGLQLVFHVRCRISASHRRGGRGAGCVARTLCGASMITSARQQERREVSPVVGRVVKPIAALHLPALGSSVPKLQVTVETCVLPAYTWLRVQGCALMPQTLSRSLRHSSCRLQHLARSPRHLSGCGTSPAAYSTSAAACGRGARTPHYASAPHYALSSIHHTLPSIHYTLPSAAYTLCVRGIHTLPSAGTPMPGNSWPRRSLIKPPSLHRWRTDNPHFEV